MARSAENTILSPDDEADDNENLPMKVYKPSTWTSQPGASLTKYGQRGQPAAALLRKQRYDTERSSAAPYVDRPRGRGKYDVDVRFTEDEEGLHTATAIPQKESNEELSSEAQNADGPPNSGNYDVDAGPTTYGLGGQPATTVPEVRLRNTKRSSPAQLSDGPHSSGGYDVVDDETPYLDRPRGRGKYDVDVRFTEHEEGLHRATAIPRSNAELSSEAQNADGPPKRGNYHVDAGPTTYGLGGQPATTVPEVRLRNTKRSSPAQLSDGPHSSSGYDVVDDETPYVDRPRGRGKYDVDVRFTEHEEGLHRATAIPRSNAELSSEAQNADGPPNSGNYDLDAGPTTYGLGGQPATTVPEVRLRNTKRSSPAQLSGPHRSGSYNVVDDETRTVQDNEVFSDVSSTGFTSHRRTAPTSLYSPKKKAYLNIPETEQRGEGGDQSQWRRLLDATSIRATLPDAPKERRSMPAQDSQGLASIPRSTHVGSSHVTPGPSPEASSRKEMANIPALYPDGPGENDPGIYFYDNTPSRLLDRTARKISNVVAPPTSTAPLGKQVAPAGEEGNESPSYQTAPVRSTVVESAGEACVEDVNDTVMCNGYPSKLPSFEDEDWQPSNDSAPLPPGYSTAGRRRPATSVRPVICVLNLGTQELWQRYVDTDTISYCTVLLWESLSLGTPKDHRMGRRGTLALDQEKFNQLVDHTKQFRTAGDGSLPIYVTLGGQRFDSQAYVSMLLNEDWQVSVTVSLHRFNGIFHGVNVYWNYPRDSCDTKSVASMKALHLFLRRLKSRNMGVMLTVPPVRDLVRRYGLTDSLLDSLSYVLVTTHKLQHCDGRASCSGLHQFAASAFLRVRTDYGIRHRQKFAYSISARVDTFLANVALDSTNNATTPEFGATSWNKSSEYLGLTEVCHAKKLYMSKDDECTLAVLHDVEDSDGVTWHRLATYTSPHQIQLRMQRAFDDAMGDTAVALFDSQLDDFSGECEAEEVQASSPSLVAAIATTGPRA
ncbi:uncharacterized protein [Dermacentor albipictus]|uniref:uncharacterized protein isoform X3 n=1 Tax=Dermacentor albipictus TaxID=60249 RepID=UPI0031FC2B3E